MKGKHEVATRMSWGERLLILNLLLVSMVCGFYIHTNRSTSDKCVSPIVAPREVRASEPQRELQYIPPEEVRQQMNRFPGLMSDIKNVFGDQWTYAAELIYRESSFNELAVNPSSGACGLAQALPCSKMKCNLSDIDCQLNWIKQYTDERYGDAEHALWFWKYKKRTTGSGWY